MSKSNTTNVKRYVNQSDVTQIVFVNFQPVRIVPGGTAKLPTEVAERIPYLAEVKEKE